MLRVTVELFPHGQVQTAQVLSRFFIINDGSGTLKTGNYRIIQESGVCLTLKRFLRDDGHVALVGKSLTKIARYINTTKVLKRSPS